MRIASGFSAAWENTRPDVATRRPFAVVRDNSGLLSVYHFQQNKSIYFVIHPRGKVSVYKWFARTNENSVGPRENSTALLIIGLSLSRDKSGGGGSVMNYLRAGAGKNSAGARENNGNGITRATRR